MFVQDSEPVITETVSIQDKESNCKGKSHHDELTKVQFETELLKEQVAINENLNQVVFSKETYRG